MGYYSSTRTTASTTTPKSRHEKTDVEKVVEALEEVSKAYKDVERLKEELAAAERKVEVVKEDARLKLSKLSPEAKSLVTSLFDKTTLEPANTQETPER